MLVGINVIDTKYWMDDLLAKAYSLKYDVNVVCTKNHRTEFACPGHYGDSSHDTYGFQEPQLWAAATGGPDRPVVDVVHQCTQQMSGYWQGGHFDKKVADSDGGDDEHGGDVGEHGSAAVSSIISALQCFWCCCRIDIGSPP